MELNIESLKNQVPPLEMTSAIPVNEWAIRGWCDVMGLSDPIYFDPSAARKQGLPSVVAPSPMLQIWTVWEVTRNKLSPNQVLRRLMTESGFPAIVATNYDQRTYKFARLGDRITTKIRLNSVSEKKSTPLGEGYFATEFHEWFNQGGELLGDLKIRCYFFRSHESFAAPKVASKPQDVALLQTDPRESLPPMDIPVTSTLVIAGALAGNDFELVHHDPELARQQGLRDIIMNIATSTGMLFRYATACAPKGYVVKDISLRLGVPCYPGNTLSMRGWIEPESSRNETRFEVSGTNAQGEHMRAKVTLENHAWRPGSVR